MKEMSEKKIEKVRLWICIVCALVAVAFVVFDLTRLRIPTAKTSDKMSAIFIYTATLVPFLVFSIFVFRKRRSEKMFPVLALFALSYFIRIGFADFESVDYTLFLSRWLEEYRAMPLRECFATQVGNYPPLYNYFLILFSRLPLKELYLIKTLSFYGEALTAFFAVKIITSLKEKEFDWLWLGILLLMPVYMTNSSQWGQCDTLYTMCAVAGIYFALQRKSPLCFVFMGLGLAFKMQMLLIYPVCLILLLAKSERGGGTYLRWRDLWIAPLVFFVVSGLPVFFGGDFFKVVKVFFNQVAVSNDSERGLNGHCPNLLLPFMCVPKSWALYYIVLIVFILLTAGLDAFIIVHALKRSGRVLDKEKIVFLCVLLPLVSVFCMPKMNDRFFYIAEIFSFIYFAAKRDRNSFTAYLALETGVFTMYIRFLLRTNPGFWWFAPFFVGIAVVWQGGRFFGYFPPPEKRKRKSALSASR